MTIHQIDYVRQVYAMALGVETDAEAALHSAAQTLALPMEAVREVVEEGVTA